MLLIDVRRQVMLMYKLMVVLCGLLLLSACGGGNNPNSDNAATTAKQMTLFVPLYAWPDLATANNDWQKVADVAPLVNVVAVINPYSGPLLASDVAFAGYVDGIAMLKNTGVKVLGYIPSGFGTRSIAAMQADMDMYKSYQIDGFFFDEVETSNAIARYQTLCNYQTNQFTVLNPGTSFPNAYIENGCSQAVVYENSEALWLTHQLTAENKRLPPESMVALVHSATTDVTFLSDSLQHARDLGIASVMVTDRGFGSMWTSQPTYLQQEAEQLVTLQLP